MLKQQKNLRFAFAWLLAVAFALHLAGCSPEQPVVRVGILHSLSGNMAVSEQAVADATLLAVEDINAAGGVLGRKIEVVVADGRSDNRVFAQEAERLITQIKVSAIFGCWSSACRKTLKPIVERHRHLLFYPMQYEGLEESPNIIYLGATPNQQILPAVHWCREHLGRRVFLVGSDYVFPRTANEIVKSYAAALNIEIAGEEYVPLGSEDMADVIRHIKSTRPDVILNSVNGSSSLAFFKALRKAGITPAQIPVMSFSMAENELRNLPPQMMAGDYAAWNYFQSLDTPRNRAFIEHFRKRFGASRVISDAMVEGYTAVMLWKQAVEDAGTWEPAAVNKTLVGQSLDGVQGVVAIDRHNRHVWKKTYIGQVGQDGQFRIVSSSENLVRPVTFPFIKTQEEWEQYLAQLQRRWAGYWVNPASSEGR